MPLLGDGGLSTTPAAAAGACLGLVLNICVSSSGLLSFTKLAMLVRAWGPIVEQRPHASTFMADADADEAIMSRWTECGWLVTSTEELGRWATRKWVPSKATKEAAVDWLSRDVLRTNY